MSLDTLDNWLMLSRYYEFISKNSFKIPKIISINVLFIFFVWLLSSPKDTVISAGTLQIY